MSYANQKHITIRKESCDKNNPYTSINLDALNRAMNELSSVGSMKLWLYLAKNQDGYSFDLSPTACESWGLKKDSYHKAVKDLIDKGYLQPTDKGRYLFSESG